MFSVLHLPRSVTICEVGPRDGFQMEREFIPTEQKVQVIDGLSATGVKEIEVTSFVHPRAIPQLRDAEDVMARIQRMPGVVYRALVPNVRGAQRALDAGVDLLQVVVSLSDSHSLSNVNRTTDEALAEVEDVVRRAEQAGTPVAAAVATALGCPFEGFLPAERLLWVCQRLVDCGIGRIDLADTVGMAHPALVYDRVNRVRDRFPHVDLGLHLHDTRRMAMANIVVALQAGITRFDGAVGGLGGCPYAPGATGNVATEDMVHMLEAMGIDTGVHLDRLLAVARRVEEVVGHPLESFVLRSGKSSDLVKERVTGQKKVGEPATP